MHSMACEQELELAKPGSESTWSTCCGVALSKALPWDPRNLVYWSGTNAAATRLSWLAHGALSLGLECQECSMISCGVSWLFWLLQKTDFWPSWHQTRPLVSTVRTGLRRTQVLTGLLLPGFPCVIMALFFLFLPSVQGYKHPVCKDPGGEPGWIGAELIS